MADEEYGLHYCQSRVYHDLHVDREAVREHQRLGAVVKARGELADLDLKVMRLARNVAQVRRL